MDCRQRPLRSRRNGTGARSPIVLNPAVPGWNGWRCRRYKSLWIHAYTDCRPKIAPWAGRVDRSERTRDLAGIREIAPGRRSTTVYGCSCTLPTSLTSHCRVGEQPIQAATVPSLYGRGHPMETGPTDPAARTIMCDREEGAGTAWEAPWRIDRSGPPPAAPTTTGVIPAAGIKRDRGYPRRRLSIAASTIAPRASTPNRSEFSTRSYGRRSSISML